MPKINKNLDKETLYNLAISRGEAQKSETDSLVVETGACTGRSPEAKFIVKTSEVQDDVDWGKINQPISVKNYEKLHELVSEYLESRDELFIQDVKAGESNSSMYFEITCEYAYQALFTSYLLKPAKQDAQTDFKILVAPGCSPEDYESYGLKSPAFVVTNMEEKTILIGGTKYAGEIKKAVFSVMNHVLPQKGVLTMHCSANMGKDGQTAVFFGLSGTGKTTLSTDENREMIGDDEHGWSDEGIFNIEGGCYAKCINLTRENEPQIYDAIRHGTILENVMIDKAGKLDFADGSLTENTRAAYPLSYIPGAIESGVMQHPSVAIFLTADAYGVMPPISRLTKEQAMYHFISGYTSKLAGTEVGVTEPEAVFSSFFGQAFMPLKPMVYANLLGKKLDQYGSQVYLINTGWSGGPYGVGERISIKYSRAMVSAALDGSLDNVEYETHPILNLEMPKSCPEVPPEVLNPRNTWKDKEAYDKKATQLANLFKQNIKEFPRVSEDIKSAGPTG